MILFIIIVIIILLGLFVGVFVAALIFGGRDPYEDRLVQYECADIIANAKRGDTYIDVDIDARSVNINNTLKKTGKHGTSNYIDDLDDED